MGGPSNEMYSFQLAQNAELLEARNNREQRR
jgi:hypothetical protein